MSGTNQSASLLGLLGSREVDPALEARVRSKLLEIEKELALAVASDVEFIGEAARHLIDAEGNGSARSLWCSPRSSEILHPTGLLRQPSLWS